MCSGEKTTTVPSESWRQMPMESGVEVDRGKDGSTSSSSIWRSCDLRRWTQRIMLNGEGTPVSLTPQQRDFSRKEREGERVAHTIIGSNHHHHSLLRQTRQQHNIEQYIENTYIQDCKPNALRTLLKETRKPCCHKETA